MIDPSVRPRTRRTIVIVLLLLASTLLFWKLRIIDLGTNPKIEIGPIDLYIEHTPMAQYAYEQLARGDLPLWNPYQLAGQPFLAVPHVAVFYPLHLYSLFLDAPASIEVSFLIHMLLGGMGMWWLARRFDLPPLAAFGSALTFMWSGWITFTNVVPGIFAALNWLPLTILLVDRTLARTRFAAAALIAAMTCQVLLGASEVLLHTLYVAAGFSLFRLVQQFRDHGPKRAARSAFVVLRAMLAAPVIAAPQLLPSLELVAQSGRGAEPVSLAAASIGAIAPRAFLEGSIGTTGLVAVGVLPLLALPIVLGSRRFRVASVFGLATAAAGALLVFGGVFYEAYYSIPVLGPLFRRPVKFLDLYAFGQALVVGVAIAELLAMRALSRVELWRDARWLACLGIAAAATLWTITASIQQTAPWIACLALLCAFGALPSSRWRAPILLGLVAIQVLDLFFSVGGTHVRPSRRPEIFHREDALLASLRERGESQRSYLSTHFTADPALTAKQGVMNRLLVSTDYEPLVTRRYQRFFDAVTPGDQQKRMNPFAGLYALEPDSRWALMDLTATRHYVMGQGERAAAFMRRHPREFRSIRREKGLQIFERPSALPRALLVPEAKSLDSEDEVLAGLLDPGFDPWKVVLLEPGEGSVRLADDRAKPPGGGPAVDSHVEFVIDEPERIVLDVAAADRRFLVLNDLHYPGWRAFVGEREVEILRANYLFRAVEVPPGRSKVRFEYAPASFRGGMWASASALMVLAFGATLRRAISRSP